MCPICSGQKSVFSGRKSLYSISFHKHFTLIFMNPFAFPQKMFGWWIANRKLKSINNNKTKSLPRCWVAGAEYTHWLSNDRSTVQEGACPGGTGICVCRVGKNTDMGALVLLIKCCCMNNSVSGVEIQEKNINTLRTRLRGGGARAQVCVLPPH